MQQLDLKAFKAIIFDLGNVLLNIDFSFTIKAFTTLSPTKADWLKENVYHAPLFLSYEKGLITDEDFRQGLRKILDQNVSDAQIDQAWNALLLDFPAHRIEILKKLRPQHQLFLLSNTNAIHIRKVNSILYKSFKINQLDNLFEKVYYSQDMKKRKPEPEIYQTILAEQNLLPSETLFLDDNQANIQAAQALGIHSILIEPNIVEVKDVFANLIQSE